MSEVTAPTELNEFESGAVAKLLVAVQSAGEYYIPLSLPEESELSKMLRALAQAGFIRWARYPEEYYYILKPGVAFLEASGTGA